MDYQELLSALRRQEVMDNLRCFGCGYEHSCSTHGCVINRAAAELIEKLTAENEALRGLPNPALTLEELCKMDGEPVWFSGNDLNCYEIFCGVSSDGIAQFHRLALPLSEYGKAWLAYRRRPEGNVSKLDTSEREEG